MEGASRTYLGVGSNLGDRVANIEAAINHLKKIDGLKIRRTSSLYETEPVGGPPQGRFLNGVVEVETTLSPRELLAKLKEIEGKLGRVKIVPDGPRTIDLDILLYQDLVVEEEDLKIPHPRMSQRRFVLEPLAEIAPDLIHPLSNKRISQLLREVQGRDEPSCLSDPQKGYLGEKDFFPIGVGSYFSGRKENIKRKPSGFPFKERAPSNDNS